MPITPAQAGQLSAAAVGLAATEAGVTEILKGEPRVGSQATAVLQAVDEAQAALGVLSAALSAIPEPVPEPIPVPEPPPPSVALKWNPARSHGAPALSNGDATVTMVANRWARAATFPVGVGRYSLKLDAASSTNLWAGVVSSAHDWNSKTQWGNNGYVGGTTNSVGYNPSTGDIRKAGNFVPGATKKTAKAGSTLDIELTASKTVIFYVDTVKVAEADVSAWPDVSVAIGSEAGSLTATVSGAGVVVTPVPTPTPTPVPTPTPSPTPSPTPTTKALVGCSTGNEQAKLATFVEWFGRKPDVIWINTDHRRWDWYMQSLGGQLNASGNGLGTLGILPVWTNPMMCDGDTLEAGAQGAYKANYTAMAEAIKAKLGADHNGIFRPCNEFNGSWMPWKLPKGKEALFAQTFRHYVDAVRLVLPKAKFEWCVQIAYDEPAPSPYGFQDMAAAYPGDAYVDYIGGDFYQFSLRGHPADADAYFDWIMNDRVGLKWLRKFAQDHGKPEAYSEYGTDTDKPRYYVRASEWFKSGNVAYHILWDRNDDTGAPCKLSDGSKPQAAAAYKAAFA